MSVFVTAAAAGDPQSPRTLNKHAAPAPDATRAASPMRVNVRMTLVPVTVIDQFGRNVTGLNKQNFKIYDGSEERPIATFGLQDAAVSRIEFIELFGSDIATGAPVCERVRL